MSAVLKCIELSPHSHFRGIDLVAAQGTYATDDVQFSTGSTLQMASSSPSSGRTIMVAEHPRYRYRVDQSDVLIWVNPLWISFAQENSARELTEEFVLGRSLWDFIAGEEPRDLYQKLHARVRDRVEPVVLPFRCDSPTLQRHMQMIIRPEDAGGLAYDCRLIKVVPQSELEVLVPLIRRSKCCLTVCSCCKRGLIEPEGWLELDLISERLRFSEKQSFPEVHHAVCPNCSQLP